MNNENLIKSSDLTSAERRERASKAGKASVEARKQKKLMRELLTDMLTQPIEDVDLRATVRRFYRNDENITWEVAITAQLMRRAAKGDMRAIEMVFEQVDGKLPNKVEGHIRTQNTSRFDLRSLPDEIVMRLADAVQEHEHANVKDDAL